MRFRRANLNWRRGGCGAGGSEGGRNTVGCNDSFVQKCLLCAASVRRSGPDPGELLGQRGGRLSTHPHQWGLGTNEGG